MTGDGSSGAADEDPEDESADVADYQAQSDLRDHVYKMALAGALVLLATGTIVYRVAEDWSWVDSFYFSAIAITTVGFGDFLPTTDFTKLFTVVYIVMGMSLIGVVLNERLRRHAVHAGKRNTKRKTGGDG